VKALVIDFETTGLTLHPDAKPELQPRAIEFAGVLMDLGGEIVDSESFLINPGQEVSAEITKITSITNEMLATAPTFPHHLDRLRQLFADASVLVAHNLPFDRAIMAHELRLLGITDWPWPGHEVCTVQLYEPFWGRRPRLIELYETVTDKKYEQTHRALDDVTALAEIVRKEKLLEFIAAAAARSH